MIQCGSAVTVFASWVFLEMGSRPSATQHRARLRRKAQHRRLKGVIASLLHLVGNVRSYGGPFGRFVDLFVTGSTPIGRHCGDLLPIPPVSELVIATCLPKIGSLARDVAELANFSLAGTNFLYGGLRAVSIPQRPTHAQRSAQERLVGKWWVLLNHASATGDYAAGFASPLLFQISAGQGAKPELTASKVDGLAECGLVDPTPCLPKTTQRLFSERGRLFPHGTHNIPRFVKYTSGARGEYARLVRRQLETHKVALMHRPTCSAGTFAVAKRDTDRLREVWNGGLISASSVEPLAPRWLADPSALIVLESSCDSPLYLSTRDGACFYDQLKAPSSLIQYFGRPQLKASELHAVGLSGDELRTFLVDGDGSEPSAGDWLTPVSLTWPMGFAHSSYVAQQVMTASCLAAGFQQSQFLTNAGALPHQHLPCVAVATDDVNMFVRLSKHERDEITEPPLQSLDDVWAAWELQPKREKCDDLLRSGVVLGVELVNGMSLVPKRKRMGSLVGGLCSLLADPVTTPRFMQSFLGTLQWTCLLSRSLLACLNQVYEFEDRVPVNRPQGVPMQVMDELCVCLSLFAYLNVDLTRPWAPQVVATDGAQDYGFGMACASCDPSWTRRIAAHCAEVGHGIIPQGVNVNSKSIRAVKAPLHVPFQYEDFTPCISVKAKVPDDAPTLEAVAVTLAARRITRSIQNHGRRHVYLLDAQALLFALRKGRSSSKAFKIQVQKVGALHLCADILATYGYIPTSCNPADPPSRGVRRTLRKLRESKPVRCSILDQCQSSRRTLRHLRASPIRCLPGSLQDKGSYDSCSSDSLTVQPDGSL